jgi:hypothetical protein
VLDHYLGRTGCRAQQADERVERIAPTEDDGMMDMDGMMDGGMWSWLAWIVVLLLVFAGIVIASIFVIRGLWNRGGGAARALMPHWRS